jgi:hypothetical protein
MIALAERAALKAAARYGSISGTSDYAALKAVDKAHRRYVSTLRTSRGCRAEARGATFEP